MHSNLSDTPSCGRFMMCLNGVHPFEAGCYLLQVVIVCWHLYLLWVHPCWGPLALVAIKAPVFECSAWHSSNIQAAGGAVRCFTCCGSTRVGVRWLWSLLKPLFSSVLLGTRLIFKCNLVNGAGFTRVGARSTRVGRRASLFVVVSLIRAT